MELTKKEQEFEDRWKEKYEHVHLSNDIYWNKDGWRTFFLLTKAELKEIQMKTEQRIEEYNSRKPKGWAGY